jgi:hypothetical protein
MTTGTSVGAGSGGGPPAAAPGAPGGPVADARPRRRGLWIAVAVITAVVVLVPTGVSTWSKLDRTTTVVSHEFGPASRLVLDLDGGQAMIQAGGHGGVSLRGTLTSSIFKSALRWSRTGSTLSVSLHCGPRVPLPVSDVISSGCWGVQLQFTVPRGLPVSASAGSGAVLAQGLSGPLHLTATSGTITGAGLTSRRVVAGLTSGDINLRFAGPPSVVSASVTSGSVEIAVPGRSRYRVTPRVSMGSVMVAPGLDDPSAGGRIDVSAGSGSLDVGYN